ncbi:hypothetical protein RJ640_008738 [Escallonia rubra]|uniref:RING-type E3 ubiquitin transferase n=1 Tax=Escallonia rubra TaxID=112253 RepID=A0AA88RRH5_9ASTE|nr:hypothetical protein RJ640_008738 [Escallonia rubra]
MLYLDDWDPIEQDHSSSLSVVVGALKASTLSLPIVGGTRLSLYLTQQEFQGHNPSHHSIACTMIRTSSNWLKKVIARNRSPFTHRRGPNGKSYGELSSPDIDISFVSSARPSIDRLFPSYDRQSFESFRIGRKSADSTTPPELSYSSFESDMSSPSQAMDEVEAGTRRLKLELKQTMDMYSTACKEAILAKQKCLLRRSPTLSWQHQFRIAAEIGTGLLFLHQKKPEPLVHRDLKPANNLLDRNYVSKISDVGLARLIPPSVADNVTQYRMTSTAGTFCYIDPDRPRMGLTHHVEKAIERGSFAEMLDQTVPDWPVEEALSFAKWFSNVLCYEGKIGQILARLSCQNLRD